MRRILLVLTVGLMMAAMMLVMAVPAFARGGGGFDFSEIPQGPNAGQPVGGFGLGGFPGGCGGGDGPNGAGGRGGGGPGGDPCII